MLDALLVLALALCAALLVVALVAAARDEGVGEWQLRLLLALLVVLVVQAVVGVASLAGERPSETATFVSYLVAVVAVPPVAAVWGRGDGSRWGSVVVAVGAVTTAVMVARVWQLWQS